MKPTPTPAPKTFQKANHWVEKKTKTEILLCSCGNKYLKTRKDQKVCVRCIATTAPAELARKGK